MNKAEIRKLWNFKIKFDFLKSLHLKVNRQHTLVKCIKFSASAPFSSVGWNANLKMWNKGRTKISEFLLQIRTNNHKKNWARNILNVLPLQVASYETKPEKKCFITHLHKREEYNRKKLSRAINGLQNFVLTSTLCFNSFLPFVFLVIYGCYEIVFCLYAVVTLPFIYI